MTTENPQAIAYQRLVDLGRERALLLADRDALQALVTMVARAVWLAVQAELTPDEIRAACQVGAIQGGKSLETQTILDPTLDIDYWLKIQAEAFWQSRSSYGEDEANSD